MKFQNLEKIDRFFSKYKVVVKSFHLRPYLSKLVENFSENFDFRYSLGSQNIPLKVVHDTPDPDPDPYNILEKSGLLTCSLKRTKNTSFSCVLTYIQRKVFGPHASSKWRKNLFPHPLIGPNSRKLWNPVSCVIRFRLSL